MDDRRVRKTKKALQIALAKLLQEKDLRHITVKELTDVADVHRATFYTHYQDVYDLYEQLETQIIEELTALLEDDFDISYKKWFYTLVTYIYENAEICKMFFISKENNQFQADIEKLFIKSCLQFYQNMYHKENFPKEWNFYISYHIQGCIAIIGNWINSNFQLSVESIVQIITNVDDNMDKLIAKCM